MSLKDSIAYPKWHGLFLPDNRRRRNWPAYRNDRTTGSIRRSVGTREHFLLNVLHEILNLALHLLHALPHLQNDRDPADVHTQIARQVENELKPLQILVRVKTRIPVGAGWLKQPFALIQPQGLRMNAVHLGHRRDHVGSLRSTFRHV